MSSTARILVTGAPGSGKSVISKRIRGFVGLDMMYVSTGNLARRMARESTHVLDSLARGKLAPRNRMDTEVRTLLERERRIVLDGYPRYMAQLDDARQIKPMPLILFLHANLITVLRRLNERHREDYNEDTEEERLRIYTQETYPLVMSLVTDYDRGYIIPADDGIERVWERVRSTLQQERIR